VARETICRWRFGQEIPRWTFGFSWPIEAVDSPTGFRTQRILPIGPEGLRAPPGAPWAQVFNRSTDVASALDMLSLC
jgi:hypothetical protein